MDFFEMLQKNLGDSKPIVLGEEFPYKKQIQPGDFIRPILTPESIDVLISLTNLSPREKQAIGNDEFDIFIYETALAPMVVFQFGEVFTSDFSLNLSKMNKVFVDLWLQSDNSTITIYLLEGTDSSVKCMRLVPFKNMKYLKSLCQRQLNFSPGEVDQWIMMSNSKYRTRDFILNANIRENIPKVDTSI